MSSCAFSKKKRA